MADDDDIVDLVGCKPSRGSGIEGMEFVVATVTGYHGTERFNMIKLISQTGANYVGTMSKSITHLVCWKFEGQKYSLAKKFRTLIVSPKWFEDCANSGKRLPEDAYLMKCGEEAGKIQYEGLLMEMKNLQTKTHSKIIADETNTHRKSEKLKRIHRDDDGQKPEPLLCFSWEQDTSPGTSRLFGCAGLNQQSCMERASSSKIHSKLIHIPSLVGDKGLESSSLDSQVSHRQKRDTAHSTISKISVGTSNKGRKLIKKNAARKILECDIADSDDDCYVVRTSQHELGNEESVDLAIDLSPQKINFLDDPVHDNQENKNKDAMDKNVSDQANRQPISLEPSCAICWIDFSPSRGILSCGHRYCYSCIQNWSDQLVLKGKVSTCPLCKEKFHSILKVDDAGASDQKMYSQTIPCAPLVQNLSFPPDHMLSGNRTQFLTSLACSVCCRREPEDLLVSCHVCQTRRIHEYCLDPPLFPWICTHCRDLRNVFQRG